MTTLISVALIITNLLSPSGLTADTLSKGLCGELPKYSEAFIIAEEDYGVNAYFLSALAGLESGWGTSDVAKNYNNLFGWTTDTGDYMSFETPEDSIYHVAKSLFGNYLHSNGKYHNGVSVSAVNQHYNSHDVWEERVVSIMYDIERRINESEDENYEF